jgi:hypothetical protein
MILQVQSQGQFRIHHTRILAIHQIVLGLEEQDVAIPIDETLALAGANDAQSLGISFLAAELKTLHGVFPLFAVSRYHLSVRQLQLDKIST